MGAVVAKSASRPGGDTTERKVSPCTDATPDSDRDIYQVEKLLRQRMRDGKHQFLIKWLRFPHSQNSWEPAANILDKSLIKHFYDQDPRATRYEDSDFQPRVTALLAEDTISNSSVIAVLNSEDSYIA